MSCESVHFRHITKPILETLKTFDAFRKGLPGVGYEWGENVGDGGGEAVLFLHMIQGKPRIGAEGSRLM